MAVLSARRSSRTVSESRADRCHMWQRVTLTTFEDTFNSLSWGNKQSIILNSMSWKWWFFHVIYWILYVICLEMGSNPQGFCVWNLQFHRRSVQAKPVSPVSPSQLEELAKGGIPAVTCLYQWIRWGKSTSVGFEELERPSEPTAQFWGICGISLQVWRLLLNDRSKSFDSLGSFKCDQGIRIVDRHRPYH